MWQVFSLAPYVHLLFTSPFNCFLLFFHQSHSFLIDRFTVSFHGYFVGTSILASCLSHVAKIEYISCITTYTQRTNTFYLFPFYCKTNPEKKTLGRKMGRTLLLEEMKFSAFHHHYYYYVMYICVYK